ncbi:formyltransferase family protein [Natronorubrum aibiense]|uniref:Formyl transferase n=1 Tax=Natronorubrum aibiense TaxID=348826 RepID=A0A5P9P973_9EURY|nr:formyltransferase family protein [Natronorubrum aibiense]QFU84654.1 formyl transferase [Natronorubrum aibiense]
MRCNSVCVLLQNDVMPAYQASAIQYLVDETAVEIPLVLINDDPRCVQDRSLQYLLGEARSWGLWLFVWASDVLTRTLRGPPAYDEPRHYTSVDALADADVVRCSPNREDEYWTSLPDDVVDRIAAETDVALRFGFGLLTGRVLDALECGVLSFHFSDIREYRGRIGALWEFLDGESTVGITLQQLTDRVDGGRIVAVEDVPIYEHDTFDAVKRRQRTTVLGQLLVDGITTFNDPTSDPFTPASLGTYRKAPSAIEVLQFVGKNSTNRIRSVFSSRMT